MHAIFFGIKRAHIEILRVTHRVIWQSWLTPARFDMLRIVQLHPDGMAQSVLRWLLGVTAPVVSRMLKSLEKLGYVNRERSAEDGRCQIVRLTRSGKVAVGMALSASVDRLEAERTAARVVIGDTRMSPDTREESEATIRAGREKLTEFDGFLVKIRKALADRAPFHHPWKRLEEHMPVAYTRLVNGRLQYGDHDPLAELEHEEHLERLQRVEWLA